jgi:Baseplate J-like protein
MSCTPARPCGAPPAPLGAPSPPPGQPRLARRVGEFHAFVRDLVARVERQDGPGGGRLGSLWDVEGDPRSRLLAELWAYVAETVAAASELTAGEAYLGTAVDWTDLRRLAALVGYHPRRRVAARGWVRVETDRGAAPLVPAGARVQASGTPDRPPQLFEVERDTQLRADWAQLTGTWVPELHAPEGSELRFLGDPGLAPGDRVLFVEEPDVRGPGSPRWSDRWAWLLGLADAKATTMAPIGVVTVAGRRAELGTTLVTFDRDLRDLLPEAERSYAAYPIRVAAASARRLEKILRIPAQGDPEPISRLGYGAGTAIADRCVVLDTLVEDLAAGQAAAVVDWTAAEPTVDVAPVAAQAPVAWEVAPGTTVRASRLSFGRDVPGLRAGRTEPVSVYLVDPRLVARHFRFVAERPIEPGTDPTAPAQVRLYPAPAVAPDHVALASGRAPARDWQVFACAAAATQERADPGRGLLIDLLEGVAPTILDQAPATANLLRVRHGAATSAVLGSGAAAQRNQRMVVPDAPVADDLDDQGNPVSSLQVRVDGVTWQELPTLFGAGPVQGYTTRLGPEGEVTVEFGDGTDGALLPTGRGNVTATWRVGGGTIGQLPSGAIDTLLGSIRGVKKVAGAGPTSGGADQDDQADLRRYAPLRARAFGRAVSREDLVDLAVGYPGVSHADTWTGSGPPDCPCGGHGLHLAFLHAAAGGPRPPENPEVQALAAFLDARRDLTVPLCVAKALVTSLVIRARLVVDPRRDVGTVLAAAAAALLGPDGPGDPRRRALGQPMDRSDVLAVLHLVPGVLGVTSFTLARSGATQPARTVLGRRDALPYELLLIAPAPDLQGAHP